MPTSNVRDTNMRGAGSFLKHGYTEGSEALSLNLAAEKKKGCTDVQFHVCKAGQIEEKRIFSIIEVRYTVSEFVGFSQSSWK